MKRIEIFKNQQEVPVLGSVIFVYVATILFQIGKTWKPELCVGFHILMILHWLSYYTRTKLFSDKNLLYFLIQGILVYLMSMTIQPNYLLIALGLIPILVCQAIHINRKKYQTVFVILLYYGMFIAIAYINSGGEEVLYAVTILILISSSLFGYSRAYLMQLEAKEVSQTLWIELDHAYRTLEFSVREKERERLARDLHDSLSQNIIGMIMKLEAMEDLLSEGAYEKSRAILSKTIFQGKAGLRETRRYIINLRDPEEERQELIEFIREEAKLFFDERYRVYFEGMNSETIYLDRQRSHHVRCIVKELFFNIIRHARADEVTIRLIEDPEYLMLQISDNGVGFDHKKAIQRHGHYGLKGIRERCKLSNARLLVDSNAHKGTIITLWIGKKERDHEKSFTY